MTGHVWGGFQNLARVSQDGPPEQISARVDADPRRICRRRDAHTRGRAAVVRRGASVQRLGVLNARTGAEIALGAGSRIGAFCVISAAERIAIGSDVLIADRVFISDHNHESRDPERPVIQQGISAGVDRRWLLAWDQRVHHARRHPGTKLHRRVRLGRDAQFSGRLGHRRQSSAASEV